MDLKYLGYEEEMPVVVPRQVQEDNIKVGLK